ncbi:hypothetical protein HR12_20825 [Microbacterium sp. SUBG005]|nr:hypothetical protein HR12_20825 [Microbacterium sp. SUBG005]
MVSKTVIWETRTGVELEVVEASGGGFERGRITDSQHVFQIDALGLSPADRIELFGEDAPRDRVLSHLVDDVPIYHGLILDWDYDDAAGTYTVTHTDLRELISGRFLYGIGGYHKDGLFLWEGLSWRGIMSRALYYLLRYEVGNNNWAVPVRLPAEEAGSEKFETWCYEMRLGESIVSDIEARPGGPDLDFQPERIDGKYGWEARIGSPFLTGPDFEVTLGAELSPLKGLQIKRRGRGVYTGMFGIGDGSEQRLEVAQVPQPIGPLARDGKVTFKSDVGDVLYQRTRGYLDARVAPTVSWSFNLDASAIDLTQLRIGSLIGVNSDGHRFARDGYSEHRVLGFGMDLADQNTVKLTLETLGMGEAEDG